jgi:hypothetical protein
MRYASLCVAVFALSVDTARAVDQQPGKPDKSPLVAEGVLQKVRQHLGRMLPFTFEGQRLKIDRKAWGAAPKAKETMPQRVKFGNFVNTPHPTEAHFRQLQSAAEAWSTGMSVSNEERTIQFSGGKLTGKLHTRGQTIRDIMLEESAEPRRTLRFGEDGRGGFRLEAAHPHGDMILLAQTPSGVFRAVVFLGGRTFAGQGISFTAFYRQHRALMEADILPVLQHFGIKPVLGANDASVRTAVLARLQRTSETLQEGQKLLADLESEKFAVREKATGLLDGRFEIYKELIGARLKDSSAALETRIRLDKILARHSDAERVNKTIEMLDLSRDALYLVSLLDHATPQESVRLIAHLEKITGQKLGSDPATWRQWAAKNVAK